jgi:uncharacterized protein involved in copper resistance
MDASEKDKARELAGRIARRLENTGGENRVAAENHAEPKDDLSALRQTLAEIQQRLAHIESHITHDETCASEDDSQNQAMNHRQRQNNQPFVSSTARLPFTSGTYVPAVAAHPSQEQFGINEAVSELVDYFEQGKTCELEPGGKPCDHCSMCSSRGF